MTTLTPFGTAIPEGKKLPPKNLAKMMAEGHPHCYVATTTVGYPVDLINKTRKGLNHVGAAFLHCYTPCQKGWVYQTSMTVELRSEERRVGKECRSRWTADQDT